MAKVYVSSTYVDLEEHRKMVSLVLRKMGHEDVAMEYYVAEDIRPVDKCIKDVAGCDLYIGIFAWRYGWVPEEGNPNGYSITEMEYRQAIEKGKECLIFLLSDDAEWKQKFIDRDLSRIARLRDDLSAKHSTGTHFKSSEELGRLLAEALSKRGKSNDQDNRIFHNLPQPNYGTFIPRLKDMEKIMDALKSRYPLITIEGFAGVGKTSLALETGYISLGRKSPVPDSVAFNYVVWVSAERKPEQKLWLNEVLFEVINTVSGNTTASPIPGKEILEMKKVNKLLQINKVLIIIDNFDTVEDPDLESWIESVPEPSKVLLTSRKHQLQKAWAVKLDGMEKDEALKFIRQEAQANGMDWMMNEADSELATLAMVTGGNPQAIVLALGLMAGGSLSLREIRNHIHDSPDQENIYKIFESLYSSSWNQLTDDAKKILLVIPLFEGENSGSQKISNRITGINKAALYQVSGLQKFEFDIGLKLLVNYNLIDVEGKEGRLSVHPMTREFASKKFTEWEEFNAIARGRWSKYFITFVKDNIKRDNPSVPYWNALVSDGMLAIDIEWPNITEVIKWSEEVKPDVFLELVMFLVHYMDSRLLNQERITLVKKAIQVAHDLGRYEEEALLRLDALGWTYVEEDNLEDAYEQITRGLSIARQLPPTSTSRNDLIALGLAWQARVTIERDNCDEAKSLIEEARSIPCSSWIETRVYMVAGDIALKDDSGAALKHYQRAAEKIKDYGEEGHGYQIEPRIGLAYLGIKDGVKEAKKRFEMLRQQDKIAIGKLYGEYGLALVAFQENDKDKAKRMAQAIVEELSPKTKSNLLQKLIYTRILDLCVTDGQVEIV